MLLRRTCLPCALFIFVGLLTSSAAAAPSLAVKAGGFDRTNTIVSLPWPKEWASFNALSPDEGGGPLIAIQVDDRGQAWFVESRLARGTSRVYRPVTRPARSPRATGKRQEHAVTFRAAGRPIASYQAEAGPLPRPEIPPVYARGGYLHPIYAPSGRVVSDDFPSNHVHHHGIWFAWTKTQFAGRAPDFWNMGDRKGRVEFGALLGQWSGPWHAGVQAEHRYIDLTASEPTLVLNDRWTVRAYALPAQASPANLFDLESDQLLATEQPLELPEYHYGGLGFRGNWDWNGAKNTTFLTSEGITNRVQGNGTRARWCYVGGLVEGQPAGIAILGHPENFRAPQPVRLHPTEPFFCFAPQVLGTMTIKPGEHYLSRYRFVVLDGAPDAAVIERYWNDYAHPPATVITR